MCLFIDGRRQIEGFQIQGAEKCLSAVGGMEKLNVKEFYDLHSSPNQGRSGKHGRGKMHKMYDGKNVKLTFWHRSFTFNSNLTFRHRSFTFNSKLTFWHRSFTFNPLNAESNPICYLLALLAHHFLHVNSVRVKSLTLRLLTSYIWSTYS